MGKTSHPPKKNGRTPGLSTLMDRRRDLAREMARVDAQISRFKPARRLTTAQFDNLLDQASEGLDHVPPLPNDFSRADLYEDRD